jgi:hypothetical protein
MEMEVEMEVEKVEFSVIPDTEPDCDRHSANPSKDVCANLFANPDTEQDGDCVNIPANPNSENDGILVQTKRDMQKKHKDRIMARFVDGTIEGTISNIFVTPINQQSESEEVLRPTFATSCPTQFSVILPKGKSKTNLSKGKRPRILNTLSDIDGDMLTDMETARVTYQKMMYELSQTSQQNEKLDRSRNTLILRIEEMNEKRLIKLSECLKYFLSEYIPISLPIPSSLSRTVLSNILKIDDESSFIHTIAGSRELQNVMRKTILDTKMLPVCCCGYIYVHPTLCFAKHPTDQSLVVGKVSDGGKVSALKRSDIIAQINALRYFLELLYEYHQTN